MDTPIATWVTTFASRPKVSSGIRSPFGTAAKASPTPITTLTIAGTVRPEKGGTTASQATMRTEASRKATRGSPETVRFMGAVGPASAEHRGDGLEDVVGE